MARRVGKCFVDRMGLMCHIFCFDLGLCLYLSRIYIFFIETWGDLERGEWQRSRQSEGRVCGWGLTDGPFCHPPLHLTAAKPNHTQKILHKNTSIPHHKNMLYYIQHIYIQTNTIFYFIKEPTYEYNRHYCRIQPLP